MSQTNYKDIITVLVPDFANSQKGKTEEEKVSLYFAIFPYIEPNCEKTISYLKSNGIVLNKARYISILAKPLDDIKKSVENLRLVDAVDLARQYPLVLNKLDNCLEVKKRIIHCISVGVSYKDENGKYLPFIYNDAEWKVAIKNFPTEVVVRDPFTVIESNRSVDNIVNEPVELNTASDLETETKDLTEPFEPVNEFSDLFEKTPDVPVNTEETLTSEPKQDVSKDALNDMKGIEDLRASLEETKKSLEEAKNNATEFDPNATYAAGIANELEDLNWNELFDGDINFDELNNGGRSL